MTTATSFTAKAKQLTGSTYALVRTHACSNNCCKSHRSPVLHAHDQQELIQGATQACKYLIPGKHFHQTPVSMNACIHATALSAACHNDAYNPRWDIPKGWWEHWSMVQLQVQPGSSHSLITSWRDCLVCWRLRLTALSVWVMEACPPLLLLEIQHWWWHWWPWQQILQAINQTWINQELYPYLHGINKGVSQKHWLPTHARQWHETDR